jgi:hypothetical protein
MMIKKVTNRVVVYIWESASSKLTIHVCFEKQYKIKIENGLGEGKLALSLRYQRKPLRKPPKQSNCQKAGSSIQEQVIDRGNP